MHDCPPVFYGTEGFPGLFPFDETVCTFYDNADSGRLYQNLFLERQRDAGTLRLWHSRLQEHGLTPLSCLKPERNHREDFRRLARAV